MSNKKLHERITYGSACLPAGRQAKRNVSYMREFIPRLLKNCYYFFWQFFSV